MVRVFTNRPSQGLRDAAVRPRLRDYLSLAVVCLFALPAWAATFTAALDRDTVSMGESVTLSLQFQGGEPQGAPTPPAVANLQFAYVGPSRQFSFVNGASSSTVTHVFTVTPRQPGSYVIPAMSVAIGGQSLTSQPLRLTVLKADTTGNDLTANQLALLRFAVPKKEVYVGEVVTVEVQLCLRDVVRNIANVQLSPPKTDGFTVLKNTQLQNRRAQIGNGVFTVVPLVYAMAATRSGPQVLGPLDCSLVAEIPGTRQRRRDVFDPFGMFESTEQRPVTAAAEAQTVQVLPLPTNNLPVSFNGAVGSYELTVSAGPTNVTVGDPITVRVQITGRGALDLLTLPEQRGWGEFKTYSATSKLENSDSLGLQGTKLFEQVVAPQSPDLKSIPAVEFSFFDPEAKVYRTLKSAPIPLSVRAAATVAPVIAMTKTAAGQDVPPPTQDIVGLKQRLGAVATLQTPLILRPWFLVLQCVPLLSWLGAFVWRKRADALANNPRLRRRKQVARVVTEGLADLRRLAAERNSDEFFAALFRVLQEQIGERLDLPASAITEAVVDERLKPAGFAEPASLHELFQACNDARYAPVHSSQELAAIVPRVEAVIEQLRRFEA